MKDKYQMTQEENIFFAKRNLVDSIYNSIKLEGLALTFPETSEIFEGRCVRGVSVEDTIIVNNLKHAWKFLLDTLACDFDLQYMKQLNYEIGANSIINSAGIFRQFNVRISGTNWKPDIPDEIKVKGELNQIKENSKSITDYAINILLYIMRTQAFADGNKRTATLAANQILIKSGKGVFTLIPDIQADFKELLIEFYETNNSNNIKEFIFNHCIEGFNSTDIKVKFNPTDFDRTRFYTNRTKGE